MTPPGPRRRPSAPTITVADLLPGDVLRIPGPNWEPTSAIFVGASPHPRYPRLLLVIWKLETGAWSFDALSPRQAVTGLAPTSPDERLQTLKAWLETERS